MSNVDTKKPAVLDGFKFVPSDGIPSVTIDKQRRFYLSSAAQKLLSVKPYERLAVLYRASTQSLAIAKPYAIDGMRYAEMSNYSVDKRYYMSARKFVSAYGFNMDKAPFTFDYDLGTEDGGIFIFQLREEGD